MALVLSTDSVEGVAWITFSEASLAFEDALWVILPSHAIADISELDRLDGMNWPAGGSFMLAREQTSHGLDLVRNPHYWKMDSNGGTLPYLDRLEIIWVDEPGLEVELFTERSVDVIVAPPSLEALATLTATVADGAEIQHVPTPIVEHLTFQFGPGRDVINVIDDCVHHGPNVRSRARRDQPGVSQRLS